MQRASLAVLRCETGELAWDRDRDGGWGGYTGKPVNISVKRES